jgi:hypothetical protein
MAMLNHKRLPETLPLGLLKRLAASPTTNFAVDTCRGNFPWLDGCYPLGRSEEIGINSKTYGILTIQK